MEKTLPLEERNIYQIYLESQETMTYVIPVYQRNYVWEEDEITALIKDVYDSFHKEQKPIYFIGTLVTYKREDSVYEVIDGQQRLTTIYIILKALYNILKAFGKASRVGIFRNKLTYGARKVSASTIQKLDDYPDLGDVVDHGIRNGYKFADKAIKAIVSVSELEEFEQYFLQNVHIIHYRVPKDVDLNHYFEVMNSRGEQLEKHEIVKSWLSSSLKDDKIALAIFSRVWEACSEMNIYIQEVFSKTEVFGSNLNQFIIDYFDKIPEQEESEGKETIMDLLNKPICKIEDKNTIEQKDKFQPIIDFPNFLLIVLKVTRMKDKNFVPTKFTLDDKELLIEFYNALYNMEDKAEFTKQFTFNLLKAKYFLDNYIVHHSIDNKEYEGDNPWKLQYYYQETTKKKYQKNLSTEQDVQKELVHLLSMFEVSFTPKQRKNYLFYCIMYLFSNDKQSDNEYLKFLQNLAHKYFYNVYLNQNSLNERNQPGPNAFDNTLLKDGKLYVAEIAVPEINYRNAFETIYKQGRSDVPLFVFNYTDYIIWKKYADELRGENTKKGSVKRSNFFEKIGCSDFELDPFNNFYFSRTRRSLEHYYPQDKAKHPNSEKVKYPNLDEINCFGNFAMIGAEANSLGSYYDPKTKINLYCDRKYDQISVSSLKFKIMMQMCLDNQEAIQKQELERENGLEWNVEDMKIHQEKMLDLLFAKSIQSEN